MHVPEVGKKYCKNRKHSDIFEGNTTDHSTLKTVVNKLNLKVGYTRNKPVVVMDAGIATEDNILFLKSEGYPYLCVLRSNIKNYKADTDSHPVQITDKRDQPIELMRVRVAEDNDNYLWIKSQAKAVKEKHPSVHNYYNLNIAANGKAFNIRVVDGFYSSLLGLPKPFFDTRKTGDMVARLNDTMRIQRVISDIVSTYIIDILILLITIVMIFVYSDVAGFISLLAIPLFFLLVYKWNKPITKSQQDLMAGYALNESNFINTLRGITEIKSMDWHGVYKARNKSIFTLFQERAFSLGKIKVKLGLIINLALISIPLSEAKVAIERMFEFTQLKPEADGLYNPESTPEITRVTLSGISFRFPGQKLFLSDIGLEIEKGRITALLGESGSGKSTLVNVLMRFYPPESGSIRVNGLTDSHKTPLECWRKSIALIPQEIHIFNGTVLENIIPDSDETKLKRLVSITTEYGLEAFVSALPLGFATLTGEDGVKLSGGQKQVIAFMRALVNDPDMLLIDEGTSGMDRDTEAIIINILERIKHSVGVLLVTHRINLIKKLCDSIYILEGNTVNVSGTHEELIANDNIYSRFWEDFS